MCTKRIFHRDTSHFLCLPPPRKNTNKAFATMEKRYEQRVKIEKKLFPEFSLLFFSQRQKPCFSVEKTPTGESVILKKIFWQMSKDGKREVCGERGKSTKKFVPANFFFSIFFSHFAKDTLIFFSRYRGKKGPSLISGYFVTARLHPAGTQSGHSPHYVV